MEGIVASRSLERLTEAMGVLLMNQCFVKVSCLYRVLNGAV
jgi:hypothetical protein